MLMERHGYDVVAETDNGVDALQLIREHLPDIVILDIGIPKLDGLEVIGRMACISPGSKVLVLTSQAAGHFSMRCMQAGAAGYVCKQQDLTELLSAIKAVLSGYSYFPNQALHKARGCVKGGSEEEMVQRLRQRGDGVEGAGQRQEQQRNRRQHVPQQQDGEHLQDASITQAHAHSLVDLIELAQRHGLSRP